MILMQMIASSLTITAIRIGGTEGSGTAGTIGSGPCRYLWYLNGERRW